MLLHLFKNLKIHITVLDTNQTMNILEKCCLRIYVV